ncbi:30S ribosomal protein S6 [Candidatus Peregrinibacteria bacterium]|nr:30S ribosomal protein S6 [Candidatus Peregrinibacteria bacterium]
MPSLTTSASAANETASDTADRDVRVYECAILYSCPIAQKDEAALMKEIDSYFHEAGATLVAKDAWGRRGLAYPIKGAKEANVAIYYWEMDPLKLKEVDQSLKISKGILRHLFVKPPKHYQIIKYADVYELWLKERESLDQKRARERQEQLEERVAAQAKRRAKMTTEKKTDKPDAKISGEAIAEGIEKLISDDAIDI